MEKIRRNVFETNSSSVHSIVLKHDKPYVSELPVSNGTLTVNCKDYDGFGRTNTKIISTQMEKVQYLISWISASKYNDVNDVKNSWQFDTLLGAIQKIAQDVKDIEICDIESACFNHQNSPHNGNECIVDLYNEDAVMNFIFNDNIIVECYFD